MIKYLSGIALAKTDTGRINHLNKYGVFLRNRYPDSALDIAQSALQKAREINYAKGMIKAMSTIGWAYNARGHYEQSIQTFKQAAILCKKRRPDLLPYIYNDYASSFLLKGNYREAGDYYYQTIQIAKQSNNSALNLTRVYLNLSSLWGVLGNKAKSLYYLNEAEACAKSKKDSSLLDDIWNSKATILLESNPSKAEQYLLRSIRLSKQEKDIATELSGLGNLANVYILQGNNSYGKKYLIKTRNLFQNTTALQPSFKTNLYIYFGQAYRLLGDYPEAERFLNKGLHKAIEMNAPMYITSAWNELSLLYEAKQDYNKAYHYQQKATILKDSLVNDSRIKEINLLEQKFKLEQKNRLIAQQQLKVAAAQKHVIKRNSMLLVIFLLVGAVFSFYFVQKKSQRRKFQLQDQQLKTLEKEQEAKRLEAIMEGEEIERERIARELHDGLGSMLSVAKLNLNAASRKYTEDGPQFKGIIELLDHSAVYVRDTAHSLLPDILLKGGLEEALKIYCAKRSKDIALEFQTYGASVHQSEAYEKNIFRTVQQVLDFAIHDLEGKSFLMQLNWQEDAIYLTLDVHGNNHKQYLEDGEKALRLEALNSRIQTIGGFLDIDFSDVDCTTLNLEFKYE